jgi:hypothetical protein
VPFGDASVKRDGGRHVVGSSPHRRRRVSRINVSCIIDEDADIPFRSVKPDSPRARWWSRVN